MIEQAHKAKGPDYGIDAPGALVLFLIIGVAFAVLGLGSMFTLKRSLASALLVFPSLCVGCSFLLTAGTMLWGSKVGKLRLRDKVLDEIPWRGEELVLDVGCGHGLMLIGAAHRLQSGKAVGIDVWRKQDQAGNSQEETWRNIQVEKVQQKAEVHEADARKLPFPNGMFDIVLSSWALHNIYTKVGREAAVREIVRVLMPGGRVVIIDIRHTRQYAAVLREAGMVNVCRSWPNFLFFTPSFTLTATKPS